MPQPPPRPVIDISTEIAEGFVVDPAGIPLDVWQNITLPRGGRQFHPRHTMPRADDALVRSVSSAYLACGLHSGDPLLLRRFIPTLLDNNVRLGAHPSYPDVFAFGQHRVPMSEDELVSVLLYQLGALDGVLREFGERVRYVKCHGKLNFDVAGENWACDAMIRAISTFDPNIIVVTPAGTPTLERLRSAGLRVAAEAFVDRGYDASGHILPRAHPRALHATPEDAVRQVLSVVNKGVIIAADTGAEVPLQAETFCVHSDTPGAEEIAHALVSALSAADILIAPLADTMGR